jgi:tryptophanyl-tRNA synthetase
MARERVVSGMRPTGRLHLGHFHGALENWVRLQEEYDCFFFVADWHALTTEFKDVSGIAPSVREMVIDWLSVGLDPERCTLFLQSAVKEHAELYLLLSMITPVGWLERNPTFKELQEELQEKDLSGHGFLGYPVLQAADIVMYGARRVPIGVDQLPHLELTREIVRRFNHLYKCDVLVEPQHLLSPAPKLLGVDNRKMSKSFGNAILLSDPPEEVERKVTQMITDPARKRRRDPGDPDVCNVFSFHKIYKTEAVMAAHSDLLPLEEVARQCRSAELGCVEDKKQFAREINAALDATIRPRRAALEKDPGRVEKILAAGSEKARGAASETMGRVRRAMGLS